MMVLRALAVALDLEFVCKVEVLQLQFRFRKLPSGEKPVDSTGIQWDRSEPEEVQSAHLHATAGKDERVMMARKRHNLQIQY